MIRLVRPFSSIFWDVPEFRRAQGKRHSLPSVLTLVTLALINQQNSLRQIAAWVKGLSLETRKELRLRRNQVPSYSTIQRVLSHLDVEALTQALYEWVEEVVTTYFPSATWQGLSIDGKTLRGSREAGEDLPALQVLNAIVHELGAFIQSQAVPAGTNELGALQPFLAALALSGRVVTLDALFTHREIAQIILDKEGHYLMRVKANQPRLLDDLKTWFDDPSPFSQAENVVYHEVDKGHGRLVRYTLHTTEALNAYLQSELHWPGVGQAFRIERRCTNLRTEKVTTKIHYAITSLNFQQADPVMVFQSWHQHWDIENPGHWVLDVVLGEDRSRARKDNLPEALSLLRRAVITLLRLFGKHGITHTRSSLSANVRNSLSFVRGPLE